MRKRINTIHFIGIGGAGMCGLAEILHTMDYLVSGSDIAESAAVSRLRELGIAVSIGHVAGNIAGADCVVYSGSIPADNVELLAAREQGISVISRQQMLGDIMQLKDSIGISGSHGKTTTTSMLASILSVADLDPTYVIGGKLCHDNNNAKLGQGNYMVVEIDESDGLFVHLRPHLAIVTNIDNDHLATYDYDMERLYESFAAFLDNLPFYGTAIVCIDDPGVRHVIARSRKHFITYGIDEEADVCAVDLAISDGLQSFRIIANGAGNQSVSAGEVQMSIFGAHNVRNALAAIAMGLYLDIDFEIIRRGLAQCRGVARRLEHHGSIPIGAHQVMLIDDYAHHPSEIRAVLRTLNEAYPNRRIVLIFQPHRYSRTKQLLEEFADVLANHCDVLLLLDVYPSGEMPIPLADSETLAHTIRLYGKCDVTHVAQFEQIAARLENVVMANDIVVTMGAGSIGQLPKMLAGGAA